MATMDKALETQLNNIEQRSGQTLQALSHIVLSSEAQKHGELVKMLKSDHGLGHGDANVVVHYAKKSGAFATDDVESESQAFQRIYVDKKQHLLPIHQQISKALANFGEFETAPKKANISYRRRKQFCLVGPATNTQVELGLNVKQLPDSPRLKALAAGQMCNYKVRIADVSEVDSELITWLQAAYDAAK